MNTDCTDRVVNLSFVSINGIARHIKIAPTTPIIIDANGVTRSQGAVIATRPPRTPFRVIETSGLP